MKTFQEICGRFNAAYNEQKRRGDAIMCRAKRSMEAAFRYQRIAAKKMGEYYNLSRKSREELRVGWLNDLLRPLLDEIEARTGWVFDDKDDLRTFGLRCECPVYVKGDGVDSFGHQNTIACVCFTPINEKKDDGTREWQLWYDTGEKKRSPGQYNPGTIGDLNGFNNVSARVESVEQIIEFLRKQMDDSF